MVAKTQFRDHGRGHALFSSTARLFVLKPHEMSLVATDGHRLAIVTVAAKVRTRRTRTRCERSSRRRRSAELARLLNDGDGDIAYERGENHLFFDVGGRLLISRMIDGQFPAYERVIPKGTTSTSSSSAIASPTRSSGWRCSRTSDRER
jgi:DNA polymerase-3 subunit beta